WSFSGRVNSRKCRMRSAAGWYFWSWRSISRKPVTLPISFPLLGRHAVARAFHLDQCAPILDRHDLAEFRTIAFPVLQDLLGPGRAGIVEMLRDQVVQALVIVAVHVRRDVDPALVLDVAA